MTEIKSSSSLSFSPLEETKAIEEIINHCQTCTFGFDNLANDIKDTKDINKYQTHRKWQDLPSKSCALKVWLANNFCDNLPVEQLEHFLIRSRDKLNILHFLLLQPASIGNDLFEQSSGDIPHQRIVSKLLLNVGREAKINFDVDRKISYYGIKRESMIMETIFSYLNYALEIMIEHGSDVNRIAYYNKNSFVTPLYSCFHDVIGVTNLDAARILLRGGAKIQLEYKYGKVKTNIYRHYLNFTSKNRWKEPRFLNLLKGWWRFNNCIIRWTCRRRRRVISNLLDSTLATLNCNISFVLPIIAEYLIPLEMIKL